MLKKIVSYLLTGLSLIFVFSNSAVGQSPKKIAYGVLLDNSGSLKKQFPDVLLLGKGVVKRINQRGPVSLFNFRAEESQVVIAPGVEWSQDEKTLNDYLDSLSIVTGQTALMAAIQSMAEKLEAKANSEKDAYGEKIIILITDGDERIRRVSGVVWGPQAEEDERRRLTNQLVKKLKASGVKVYAVGLLQELKADGGLIRKTPRETAESFLKKITKETNGRVVFPKSKKIDVDSLLNELLAE